MQGYKKVKKVAQGNGYSDCPSYSEKKRKLLGQIKKKQ